MHFFIQGLSPASVKAFNVNFEFSIVWCFRQKILKVWFKRRKKFYVNFIIPSFENNFHSKEVRDTIDVNDFDFFIAPTHRIKEIHRPGKFKVHVFIKY